MRRRSTPVRQSSEHSEQVGFVMWFRLKFPNVLIFAIPNGSQRSKVTGKHLKEEGVVPGIPDLYIPEWKVWIEMKREYGGTVSDVQEGVIRYLKSIGDTVIVGYGATDASKKILGFKNLYDAIQKARDRLDMTWSEVEAEYKALEEKEKKKR